MITLLDLQNTKQQQTSELVFKCDLKCVGLLLGASHGVSTNKSVAITQQSK